MKKRIQGTDISITVKVYSGSSAYNLTGKTLSAYIIRDRKAHRLTQWTVNGNEFTFTFYGKEQMNFGAGLWSIRLWENEGTKPGQKLLADEAFLLLVPAGSTITAETGDIVENVIIVEGGSSFDIHSLTSEDDVQDADEFVHYDVSASAAKKTTWSNFKAKLTSAFNLIYAAVSHTHTSEDVTGLSTLFEGKVDKVTGKGLSTNDYDATEKAAVAANTAARHSHNNLATLSGITAALVSAWDNAVTLLDGHSVSKDVPSDAVFTDTIVDNTFVVTFTFSGSSVTSDKTIAQIVAAVSAGKTVVGYYGDSASKQEYTLAEIKMSGMGARFVHIEEGNEQTVTGEIDGDAEVWTYEQSSSFTGASASSNGAPGFVPVPYQGDQDKYLAGDGTWKTLTEVPAIDTSIDSSSVDTDTASAKAVYDLAFPDMVTDTATAAVTVALQPDKTYKYLLSTGVTSLAITLGAAPADGAEHFWRVKFLSGSTATNVTWPADTYYPDGEVPTIEANKIYEAVFDNEKCLSVQSYAQVTE